MVCKLCGRDGLINERCGERHNEKTKNIVPELLNENLIRPIISMLSQMQPLDRDLGLHSTILERVSLNLEQLLLDKLQSSLQDIDITSFPFLAVPLEMNASSMANINDFYKCLTRKSVEVMEREKVSEIIHRCISQCFPIPPASTSIDIEDMNLKVRCRADGHWNCQMGSYVIEVKTIRSGTNIYNLLEKWLRQIACYQLAYPDVNILLWIIEIEHGNERCTSHIYHVLSRNIQQSIQKWSLWFRQHRELILDCIAFQQGYMSLSTIFEKRRTSACAQLNRP